MAAKTISTVLKKFKECKGSVRFNTKDRANEKTFISVYVLNEAYQTLGSPNEIAVTISADTKKKAN